MERRNGMERLLGWIGVVWMLGAAAAVQMGTPSTYCQGVLHEPVNPGPPVLHDCHDPCPGDECEKWTSTQVDGESCRCHATLQVAYCDFFYEPPAPGNTYGDITPDGICGPPSCEASTGARCGISVTLTVLRNGEIYQRTTPRCITDFE